FLQDVVNMLAPIEKITHRVSGASYPTFSAFNKGETKEQYLGLIYGSITDENDNTDNSSSSISDGDNTPSCGTHKHWQYAYRQFRQHIQRGRAQQSTNVNNNNAIEYLPSIDPNGLLQRVRAAIYLSLDELWAIPSDIALITSILDPRFKTFQWAPNQFAYAKGLLERAYIEMKTALELLSLNK
ncbi:10557_t:CDS:2, partial [Dentiscutata erythropus]